MNEKEYNFRLEILKKTREEDRCPHLRTDEASTFCSKGMSDGENPSNERRGVTDLASLQMWCCAGKGSYEKCCWYSGQFSFKDQ